MHLFLRLTLQRRRRLQSSPRHYPKWARQPPTHAALVPPGHGCRGQGVKRGQHRWDTDASESGRSGGHGLAQMLHPFNRYPDEALATRGERRSRLTASINATSWSRRGTGLHWPGTRKASSRKKHEIQGPLNQIQRQPKRPPSLRPQGFIHGVTRRAATDQKFKGKIPRARTPNAQVRTNTNA